MISRDPRLHFPNYPCAVRTARFLFLQYLLTDFRLFIVRGTNNGPRSACPLSCYCVLYLLFARTNHRASDWRVLQCGTQIVLEATTYDLPVVGVGQKNLCNGGLLLELEGCVG